MDACQVYIWLCGQSRPARSVLCLADDPKSSPFLKLLMRYMDEHHAEPGRLAAAKQHQPLQWVTDEAAKALLEQGACSRTAHLEHLAKRAKMLPQQHAHPAAEGNGVAQTASTATQVSYGSAHER